MSCNICIIKFGFFNRNIKPEYFVNKVQLNNGEKNWYLIEMLNEKAILKRDGKDKVYRIVDSKDIKYLEDTNHN